jgi:ABC-type multidrug transport system fused ATPase/permease subunit/CRP-like cAMP-binding protein
MRGSDMTAEAMTLDETPAGFDHLHPQLPGEATVGEMLRSFWPFTTGQRRFLLLDAVISLAQFALLAVLPLLTGSTLATALDVSGADQRAKQFVGEWLEAQRTSLRIASELTTPGMDLAATTNGVRAAIAQSTLAKADELLELTFPDGLVYRDSGGFRAEISRQIGESEAPYAALVRGVVADDVIARDEVELWVDDTTHTIGERALAFDYTVSFLLINDDARATRKRAASDRLTAELLVLLGASAGFVALRSATNFIALRSVLGSGRRLQDRIVAAVHDTELVAAGAIPRPSMISRCSSYVERVLSALLTLLTTGIPAAANLVLASALLMWIDLQLGLLLTGVVVMFELLRRRISPSWSRASRRRIDINTELGEALDGAITQATGVRSIGAASVERQHVARVADRVRFAVSRVHLFSEGFDIGAFAVGQVAVIVVIGIVGFTRGDLSVGTAASAVLYAQAIASAIDSLPKVIVDLQEAAPYMRRLRRVMLAPPIRHEPASPTALPEQPRRLGLADVASVRADGTAACASVNIEASSEQWTVLVGPLGSGCDTVLELASGRRTPSTGAVVLDQIDLSTVAAADLQRGIAVLPAATPIVPGTLRQNLTLLAATDTSDADVLRTVETAGLRQRFEQFPAGLDTEMTAIARHLSLEDRARLGVARMLLCSAPVVVLDDVTTGLDRDVADELWAGLRAGLRGRIVLARQRRLETLVETDWVVVFAEGTVAEAGRRADLLARQGAFWRLWRRVAGSADTDVDLATVPALRDITDEARAALAMRLVTERYEAGQTVFSAGDVADRLFVVIEGVIDLMDGDQRVASLGAGNHFGDFNPSADEPRTVTAVARSTTVVGSLHRMALSSGSAGMLDRPLDQRRVHTWLVRHGVATRDEMAPLAELLDVDATLRELVQEGAVVATNTGIETTYRVAAAVRRRRSAVLEQLGL